MWHKRYGYKEPSSQADQTYSRFVEFRFFLIIMIFLWPVLSGMLSNDRSGPLYVMVGLVYLVLGFLPELYAPFKNYLILAFGVFCISMQLFANNLFGLIHFKAFVSGAALVNDGVFLSFHFVVMALSLYYFRSPKKTLK